MFDASREQTVQAFLSQVRLLHELRRLLLRTTTMKKALALALCAGALLAAATFDGSRWWSHVEFLASDQLEGRNTGSPGHRKAAEYVAGQFEKDGLKPAGEQGYIQPVRFKTLQLDEARSSLALIRNGKEQKLTLGEDAIIGTRVDPAASVNAGLVFVGYGLKVPESHYDDFAGLDTKGKIAVYMTGSPASLSAALSAHYQSGGERWEALKAAGMIGAVSIANPKHMDIPWPRIASNRFQMTMQLAAPGMNETAGEQIGISWNPAHAEELLAGTGHKFEDIVDLAEARKQLPRFAIPATLKAAATVNRGEVESQNIAAIYPGSDPKLRGEYVVLSAHVDHLGVGKPINGDPIFNGAMDNAAGVATILDVAAHLKESNAKTRRSILFVAVTGEEKGDLGSDYFAVHPTVPVKSMIADINCDMFLPLYPLKLLTVAGVDESTLGDDIRTVAQQMGVRVQPDPQPARNIFIRSDQYSFVKQGVPSVFPFFGNEKGSKEEAIENKWLEQRYHAPSDDLNQPVDKAAAGKFDELIALLLERVANADQKPAWKDTSFFKRFAK
jgi:Zn-dependent M28 family amino/carboxypeptidase